jgi:arsenite oxidase small subunit
LSNPSKDEATDKARGRRGFFRLTLAAAGVVTLAGLGSFLRYLMFIPPPTLSGQVEVSGNLIQPSWPRVKLLNLKTLESLKPVRFNYPLVNTPNFLVKLNVKADNGIGPDGDIVAYSSLCQHLGCYIAFQPSGASPPCDPTYKTSTSEGYCCCHGGEYDFTQGGKVIGGPPPRPVPHVLLEYDKTTGDIYAVGMSEPTIFGHGPPGTTNAGSVLSYDLQGGEIVTDETVFSG